MSSGGMIAAIILLLLVSSRSLWLALLLGALAFLVFCNPG
jgi:hypothetical protein